MPMKSLSQVLESAGCEHVKTYIQSGNIVFKAEIQSAARFGEEVGQAIASNPYPDATSEPKTLHLSFLEHEPEEGRISAAKTLLAKTESFTVKGNLLYLHAPDGIGRSKFAAGIERVLHVKMTGRNWRTVTKLEELAATLMVRAVL